MTRYFTHYWQNETWFRGQEESYKGQQLSYCASNLFRERGMKTGDEVYVVTVLSGALYVCAKMVVANVFDVDDAAAYLGRNPDDLWEANDYIVPSYSSPKRFDLAVPLTLTARLKFLTNGEARSLKFSAPGLLDQQTLRGVRELTPESAAELDEILPSLKPFKATDESGSHNPIDEEASKFRAGIPTYIERSHILKAIEHIDSAGVPDKRHSTKFDLLYEGKKYPPKYVISLSHLFARGEELSRDLFSGGEEANNFLKSRGFQIVPKEVTHPTLSLYEDYTREDVHDIFSPDSAFTPQRGTWGLHGIIGIPNRPNDYVLFVTYGQQAGEHVFDEGVTEEGVLTWQSQPSQTLNDRQIQQFIQHDELKNSIHVFLRTKTRGKYTYLGRLKYLSHDTQREKPVHFQWQILEWAVPQEVLMRMGLELQSSHDLVIKRPVTETGKLSETLPPTAKPRKGVNTPTFRARKVADYSERDARNKELGTAGELLVVKFEREQLTLQGRPDLSDKVRHVAVIEGDGAGYDVESFTREGVVKYIEVKTTKGPAESAFFMSSNEVAFAKIHKEHYYLYRVYEYDKASDSGKFYIIRGNVDETFNLTPTQYRVTT
jgi:hypothetical protein